MQKGVLPKTSEAVFNRSSQNSRVKPSMKKWLFCLSIEYCQGFYGVSASADTPIFMPKIPLTIFPE